MDQPISNASLSFTCNQNWDNMKAEPRGRFCNSCQKKVYDFTDKNAAYFREALAESSGGICGRFNIGQLVPAPSSSKWKKWASAAIVLIGLSSFMQKAKAQRLGEVVVPPKPAICDSNLSVMMGKIAVSREPEFPGGKVAMAKFLDKNLRVPAGTADGELLLRFLVQKDGSLRNFQVMKSLGNGIDNEALRVMKLSPKWVPGYAGITTIEMACVLPIRISKQKSYPEVTCWKMEGSL